MVVTYRDWHEMLPFALHGYQTSVRTPTGAIPFSLVYGMEAVLPVEVQIPSLRVLRDVKLQEAEWAKEGLKRTTASSMIVCASVKASWIIPGRDRSEASCSEGRKHGESEDIWGVTELELDEITGFTLPLG
ncbi:hypothetical protein KIW84_013506 [Lathyrus oleraceus]|uniref:Uncharacterized protein n=1 Tax=Pisum sativum TaxID=3888 RepID=A0A9D5BKI7_PEA|nr:hypothetical protein KIW84_013506 [Pisum sativum]